ncbi:MAG: EAL domain-containing protein [Nevskiaceae bacterium]|nr:MAG: EAL domain-containing protein [Nevskiaceae bacterium]
MRSQENQPHRVGDPARLPPTSRWRLSGYSITVKLVVMVGCLAAVGVVMALTITLASQVTTGIRAYVGGEGLYTKGQKEAIYHLERFARSGDGRDYQLFLDAIAIPLGDHDARVAMQRPVLDYAAAERGFLQGGNDAEDVPSLISTFRRFHAVSYFARAIELWTAADAVVAQLVDCGEQLHREMVPGPARPERVAEIMTRVALLDAEVTPIEREFSHILGAGARAIRGVVMAAIYLIGGSMLAGALWLSWRIGGGLRDGIADLRRAATRAAEGDLDQSVPVRSGDELGRLTVAFNQMIEQRRGVEAALRDSTDFLQKVMLSARDAIYALDLEGHFTLANPRTCEITGYALHEILGTHFNALYEPEQAARVAVPFYSVIREGATVTDFETPLCRKDGRVVLITFSVAPLIRNGEIVGAVGTADDVTERRRNESELKARGAELARLNRIYAVLSNTSDLIVRVASREELLQHACRIAVEHGRFQSALVCESDPAAGQRYIVAAAGVGAGYATMSRLVERACPLGHHARVLCNDLGDDPAFADVRAELADKRFRSMAVLPFRTDSDESIALVLFSEEPGFFNAEEVRLLEKLVGDLSLKLNALVKEIRLQFMVHFDPLTELANRHLFHDRLAQKLQVARQEASELVLIVLEIEQFDALAHSMGQSVADEVLVELTRRLRANLGGARNLALVTQKRFAVMMLRDERKDGQSEAAVAAWIERRLFSAFADPFAVEGRELRLAGRSGVSMFPTDAGDARELLRNAEAAMDQALAAGERVFFYAPAQNTGLAQRLLLATRLRRAVEREEFEVYYQPKIDLADGVISGVEALLRWRDPDQGYVRPGEFIPILEETGLILEVSRWLLHRVAADLNETLSLHGDPPRVAVNISPLHLQHRDFLADIREAVARGGRYGDRLDIEITESMVMQDIDANVEKLRQLREAGIGVAIDDFGTGYSSLAWLSRLPATAVKLDYQFVSRMLDDPQIMSLVSTIISLAHSLKLKVTAEGVEQAAQRDALRRLRCDEYQGFLFSAAVPVARLAELLAEHAPRKGVGQAAAK